MKRCILLLFFHAKRCCPALFFHSEKFPVLDVEQDIANKKRKGLPVAKYDLDSKRAYLESADGTRERILSK
jgi:hypothetical protein